jgi:predicted dehydrogenase
MAGDRVVNWGILSSARIARNALVPAIEAAENARLVCLGTPRADRVKEIAENFQVRVLPSYEAVLDDPSVAVVYNPLPNGMHAEWTIRALAAGKHVLCEKPFSVYPEESERMIAAAQQADRRLMEAFMYRFHPQMALAKETVESGRLGALRLIRANFTFNLPANPENPRFQREQGPGALMDVGCYCVNATRFLSGGPPVAVAAWATWDEASGGDMTTAGLLEYEGHAGLFDCSFAAAGRSGIEVVGSEGRMEIPRPWLPGVDPAVVRVWDADGLEELATEGVNQYQLMVEHFSDCVLNGQTPAMPPEDALENVRVLEAARRSAREGRRVELSEV